MSYFIARFSESLQVNAFSDAYDGHKVEQAQRYDEVLVMWNSQKLNRTIGKTRKFYCTPGGKDFGSSHLGKAYAYINKLLQGSWLTDAEYDNAWTALTRLEHDVITQASLWNNGYRSSTGLYLRGKLEHSVNWHDEGFAGLDYVNAVEWYNDFIGIEAFNADRSKRAI